MHKQTDLDEMYFICLLDCLLLHYHQYVKYNFFSFWIISTYININYILFAYFLIKFLEIIPYTNEKTPNWNLKII